MSTYRLDRSAHIAGKLKDQRQKEAEYWAKQSVDERMKACWYSTCMAYGIDPKNPPRIDKTVFSAEKRFK